MRPPMTIISALPPVVGDGGGASVTVGKTDVAVNITSVAVEVGKIIDGVCAGWVTVAVWVGICI